MCVDGGNPDLTRAHGKNEAEARRIQQQGRDDPNQVAGVESHRCNLIDWLEGLGLIDARAPAELDRYIGCFKPCDSSQEALDADKSVQEEAREVSRAVVQAIKAWRGLRLSQPDKPDMPDRPDRPPRSK